MLANIPLMLAAVFAMGIHSTFFGPIKYAILPQHLSRDEVLGGTGLVEAGTYIAILGGTILAGRACDHARGRSRGDDRHCRARLSRRPPGAARTARGRADPLRLAHHPRLDRAGERTLHIPRLFLAICSISFFWTIGAVLIIVFPPLVKNVLGADEQVASLFIAIFSIGIAIGSVLINRLLKSEVSARFAPASVIAMGVFVLMLHFVACPGAGTART